MATPSQKPRLILANSSALSRLFDSLTYHTSGVAIEQFGQRAIMVVPPNPNFTKTISSGLRQCGQQSAWSWSSLITPTSSRRNWTSQITTFSRSLLCFSVPSRTCDNWEIVRGVVTVSKVALVPRHPFECRRNERQKRRVPPDECKKFALFLRQRESHRSRRSNKVGSSDLPL